MYLYFLWHWNIPVFDNFSYFSDASGLKEAENVRDSQEKVVQALQNYTSAQYPDMPSKFAELLLRMPELHRVCQVNIYFWDELLENFCFTWKYSWKKNYGMDGLCKIFTTILENLKIKLPDIKTGILLPN